MAIGSMLFADPGLHAASNDHPSTHPRRDGSFIFPSPSRDRLVAADEYASGRIPIHRTNHSKGETNMRKRSAAALALTAAMFFAACGSDSEGSSETAAPAASSEATRFTSTANSGTRCAS